MNAVMLASVFAYKAKLQVEFRFREPSLLLFRTLWNYLDVSVMKAVNF